MKKTAEEIAKEILYLPVTNGQAEASIAKGAELIYSYQEQFTAVWAITNLDAEDLGSSILRTYSTNEEAYTDLELIESGEHPEFFRNLNLDVFEIKLPSPPKQ